MMLEEMRQDLAQLRDLCERCWAYRNHHQQHLGIDLAALHEQALAAAQTGQVDFANIVRTFLDQLRDGHARIAAEWYMHHFNDAWSERIKRWQPLPPTWRMLDEGVAYLKIPTFAASPEAWGEASTVSLPYPALCQKGYTVLRRAFGELTESRALILDLRGNGGGAEDFVTFILSFLINQHVLHLTCQTRLSREFIAVTGAADDLGMPWRKPHEEWVVPMDVRFGSLPTMSFHERPVAILVDEETGSASLNLVLTMRHYRRDTRVIGRRCRATAGAGMRIAVLKHAQIPIELSTMMVWGADGDVIEGRMVEPDIITAEPVEGEAADQALVYALQALRGIHPKGERMVERL